MKIHKVKKVFSIFLTSINVYKMFKINAETYKKNLNSNNNNIYKNKIFMDKSAYHTLM